MKTVLTIGIVLTFVAGYLAGRIHGAMKAEHYYLPKLEEAARLMQESVRSSRELRETVRRFTGAHV